MNPGVVFKKYKFQYQQELKAIFFSNVPVYFHEDEWSDFNSFLQDDINATCVYDVCMLNNIIVGAGGIALEEEGHVTMTWGMVHAGHHKTGLGKLLLEHRLSLAEEMFSGAQIQLSTTQHVNGFFEKYGFCVTESKKDFWAPGLDLYKMILD